jgi:methylthioribulose-1-phosphate dehydratase
MAITTAPIVASPELGQVRRVLVAVVQFLNDRGWTPATSSNFSARVPGFDDAIAISRSGVDKAAFTPDDVIVIDTRGQVVWPERAKSSAETLLHTLIYDLSDAGAVLHTHSLAATALSLRHRSDPIVSFADLELLKGLSGITTHAARVDVPIFANDQDMVRLSEAVRRVLTGREARAFLIVGHGVYTWGATLADARRHLEVFEYLFELALRLEDHHGNPHYS